MGHLKLRNYKIKKERNIMKFIIAMNDGTDEIYNLNGFEAETLEEAQKILKEHYSISLKEDPGATPEELGGTDMYFTSVDNEAELAILLMKSNGCNQTPEEDKELDTLYNQLIGKDPNYWGLQSLQRIFNE